MLNSSRLKSRVFDGEQSGMRPLALVVFRTDHPEILDVEENAKEIRNPRFCENNSRPLSPAN
jgi:hypothetical protein